MKPKTKLPLFKNPLEMLRDSASNEFVRPMASEFMDQILGRKKFSGELELGGTVQMREVFSGKQKDIEHERHQFLFERQLFAEEKVLVEKRSRELRLQIEAIQVQVTKLAQVTPKLAREVEIASFQAPSSVSIYELFFLQHIYKLIKDFTAHIERAHVWLYTANQRARKKNVWGAHYKKYGAKYLLSGEHYSQRSAA